MTTPESAPQADLVFEGGGVKGIGLAGAYRELSDRGYRPACVAGTSAGAITAALVAVGYSGAELQDIVLHQMHFQDFEDPTFLDHFGTPGELAQFFVSRGIHSGKYFSRGCESGCWPRASPPSDSSATPRRPTRTGFTGYR